MRVELNSLPTNRSGHVKRPARRQHAPKLVGSTLMTSRIYVIPVAAKTDVLKSVQARQRTHRSIAVRQGNKGAHPKVKAWMFRCQRAQVNDLHMADTKEVRDEPVDAGADIHVKRWLRVKNP